MSEIIEVTENNFKKEVLDSETPVLVDFWAPWCQPCLMMSSVLEELSKELNNLKIAKINTEIPENQALAVKYNVQSIPNMKLFKGGEVIKEFVGLHPKEVLKEKLTEIIDLS